MVQKKYHSFFQKIGKRYFDSLALTRFWWHLFNCIYVCTKHNISDNRHSFLNFKSVVSNLATIFIQYLCGIFCSDKESMFWYFYEKEPINLEFSVNVTYLRASLFRSLLINGSYNFYTLKIRAKQFLDICPLNLTLLSNINQDISNRRFHSHIFNFNF